MKKFFTVLALVAVIFSVAGFHIRTCAGGSEA